MNSITHKFIQGLDMPGKQPEAYHKSLYVRINSNSGNYLKIKFKVTISRSS